MANVSSVSGTGALQIPSNNIPFALSYKLHTSAMDFSPGAIICLVLPALLVISTYFFCVAGLGVVTVYDPWSSTGCLLLDYVTFAYSKQPALW